MKTTRTYLQALFLGLAVLLFTATTVEAKTADPADSTATDSDEKGTDAPEPARIPAQVFESLNNNVSGLEFYSTNYGILFLNVRSGRAGGIYPRGSNKPYLFGGGIWFGAKKFVNDDPKADPNDPNAAKSLQKLSVISYNPNSGASWMVPGEITQPYEESGREENAQAINKYRIYFSTDYNSFTGAPVDPLDVQNNGAYWPIWDTDPSEVFLEERYLGRYISELSRRNRETFPKGPAIVSGEDIVSIFKDTDLSRYEGLGEERARRDGYPLGIEVDQRIYSWGFGQYNNFIFIRYSIVNKSNDTLYDCFTAPALDTDIGPTASNDRMRTVIPDADQDTLDLGVQWSETSGNDVDYGYMGADFLESPAVDRRGFIRRDKKSFDNDEQLGLHTLRNWIIDIDPRTPQDRYEFMAGDNGTPVRDGDNLAGDKRFLMSTGPFNMVPGDTARVVIGILIAPAKSANPDGTWEDMDSLIKLDLFAQKVYDNNFLAPRPPDRSNVEWRPLDNGVELSWDSTSELSVDQAEAGLDFLGYVIRRGRKAAGSGVNQYDTVVGFNIGFKTIATIPMPALPSPNARVIAHRNNNLAILGPWWRLPMLADTINDGRVAARLEPAICYDTLRRRGFPDSVIERTNNCFDTVYAVTFNPYDDANNDSTLFNDLSGYWWNDGTWGDRFSNKAIRDIVREAIVEVMDSISNGRTFIDVGDDNGDGRIISSPTDLAGNEKLINNIDYYYQVLAYDQGEPDGSTPRKLNSPVAGVNEVRATPEAPPAMLPIQPEIISQEGLVGISNFQVLVFDQQRLGQLFGGDELTFEFKPYDLYTPSLGRFFFPLWYTTEIVVTSKKLGEVNRFAVDYDLRLTDRATAGRRNVDTTLVSRSDSVLRDTIIFRLNPDSQVIEPRDSTIVDRFYIDHRDAQAKYSNTFVTEPGIRVLGTNGITKNTIGISFDWTALQQGDSLRFGKFTSNPDELLLRGAYLVGTPLDPFEVVPDATVPNTNLTYGRVAYGNSVQDPSLIRNIPSISNAKLELSFEVGGTEDLVWEKAGKTYRVNGVTYLVPKVKNVRSFQTDPFGSRPSRTIEANYDFPADDLIELKLDTADNITVTNPEESIRLVEAGKFAVLAYDWTDTDGMSAQQRRTIFARASSSKKPSEYPIGTPNRYYVGAHTATLDDGSTVGVRFTHRVIANGAAFFLDFAGMGTATPQLPSGLSAEETARVVPENRPTTDFSTGDKVLVEFSGGAAGLPNPGAKVVVSIPDPRPESFNDELLDAVTIVPNPYLIDHIGQRTSGDKKLYFTRLPEECTIQIYTAAGELLTTIEHSAADDINGRVAVNAWDLVTSAGRQVESQLLIARITTPDGAETIKKFSVVIGGFRLLTN